MKLTTFIAFLLPVSLACNNAAKQAVATPSVDAFHYTSQKKVTASNGAVVSAHPLASEVGLSILKQGGNAIDAAIATQLTLAVVYPGAGNLGGGGFLVARLGDGKELALDYREKAPAGASRDMYLEPNGDANTDKSQNGHLAGGVPGTVAGLFEAAKFGKLPFEKLIAPAIELAEKGFAITAVEASSLNSIQGDLEKYNSMPPVFLKKKGWNAGDTLVQTDLANTLKRIKEKGAAGFYEGETARLVVEEMKRGGGIITLEDMKNYSAKPRTAHTFNYKGYKIIGMPMPSSGGVLLHQMLKMTESRDIGAMGFQSPASVQLMIEVERRSYADRAEYMGDADFFKVPVDTLVSDQYLIARMRDYDSTKAGVSEKIKPGLGHESKETTHLSVIDKDGNAVAATTTLNGSYGSRTVIGGAGFFLNNEMDDFSVKPGVPNMYGAIGGEANAVMPGKRMLSSMTPTIVLKDNKPFLVVGTPGGTTIPTSVFQTIINIIDFNLSTEDAVYKPKFHHQWLPDEVYLESGFLAATKQRLLAMGYKIVDVPEIGRTEVIKVLPDGKFEAVADKRGEDSAAGW